MKQELQERCWEAITRQEEPKVAAWPEGCYECSYHGNCYPEALIPTDD